MPGHDPFANHQRSATSPAIDAYAVDPYIGQDLPTVARAFYVGTPGDVSLVTLSGNSVVFRNFPAGTVLPCSAIRVESDTTAGGVVALV